MLYTDEPSGFSARFNSRACPDCGHLMRLHTWQGCVECEPVCDNSCCCFDITTIDQADNVNCWFCGSTLRVIDG